MDFIERWFGVSPDNGSGTAELLVLLVASAVVVGAGALLLSRLGIVRSPAKAPYSRVVELPSRPDTFSP
jgi:hypothetical protein